jgi:hypothetical protein
MIFVWHIPTYLQALLLWLLIRGRVRRVFPFFFAYNAFGVAAGAARFVTLNRVHAYFWTYWLTDAIYIILATFTLFEVFRSVLRDVTRAWWRHLIFPGVIAASILLTAARVQAVPPHWGKSMFWMVTSQIAVRFAQVLTFASLVSLVPLLGVYWHGQSRSIAAGYGMYATLMLWMTTKVSDSGVGQMRTWDVISIAAYSAMLAMWIWAFRRPRPSLRDA